MRKPDETRWEKVGYEDKMIVKMISRWLGYRRYRKISQKIEIQEISEDEPDDAGWLGL